MYVTTFSSVGTLLRKGGRVRPQPLSKTAAYGMWVELNINHLNRDTKNVFKRKHALWLPFRFSCNYQANTVAKVSQLST